MPAVFPNNMLITTKRRWRELAPDLPSQRVIVRGLKLGDFCISAKQDITFDSCTFGSAEILSPRAMVTLRDCRFTRLDIKTAYRVNVEECRFYTLTCGSPGVKRLPGDTVAHVDIRDSTGEVRADASSVRITRSNIMLLELANTQELYMEKSRVAIIRGSTPDINIWSSDTLIHVSFLPVMTAEADSRGYLVNLMRHREAATGRWALWVTAGCRSMSFSDACLHWRRNTEMLDILYRGARRFNNRYGHMLAQTHQTGITSAS